MHRNFRLAFLICVCITAAQCGVAADQPQASASRQAAGHPNVLLIAIDDLNAWVGALGGHPLVKTPHLDRLFARSVYFTNAHCTAPVCAASRNSFLSGLRPTTTGWYDNVDQIRLLQRDWESVLKNTIPLPRHFRDNGYVTMAAGKIYHTGVADFDSDHLWNDTLPKHKWPAGFQAGLGRYDTTFGPLPADGGQIFKTFGRGGDSLCWSALTSEEIPGGAMPDELVAQWAVGRLQQNYDRPFLLAAGFVRPHLPYTVPARFFDLYPADTIGPMRVAPGEMSDIPIIGKAMAFCEMIPGGDDKGVRAVSETYRQELVRAYLACVSFVDEQVGKVVDALDASPYGANTIVVLLSDHGQHLGEKKHWRKMALWEESTRVPLAIRTPSMNVTGACPRSVSLLDVYPTLVELCNLPKLDTLEGTSLTPLLRDPIREWDRPALITWHYKNHAVRSDRWRYIVYRDGTEELYDHATDPTESTNLAGDPHYAGVVKAHREWLPKSEAMPNKDPAYSHDVYDDVVSRWKDAGGPPEWLRE